MTNSVSSVAANSSNKRLMLILSITVALTIWTALQEEYEVDDLQVAKPLRTPRATPMENKATSQLNDQELNKVRSHAGDDSLIPWQKLKREPLSGKAYDLFKVHSWVVIPPLKKVKLPPPPPPMAPPAPFQYVGKLEDSPKGTQVFLMLNGKLYTVVKGEKINQQWRFEAEDSNTLKLTYLPLNLVQTLSKAAKPSTASVKPLSTDALTQ